MMNMTDLFGKLTDFKNKMEETKQELGSLEVEAEVGGGMVKVVANGNREIISIKLDKDIVDPDDTEMLEDLIIAGVNQALKKAEEAAQDKMGDITRGMLPPGFDPGQFGLK